MEEGNSSTRKIAELTPAENATGDVFPPHLPSRGIKTETVGPDFLPATSLTKPATLTQPKLSTASGTGAGA